MRLSSLDEATALISYYEGCRLKAYQCSAGRWTIGFGRTYGVKPGDTCTTTQALRWLKEDTERAYEGLLKVSPVAVDLPHYRQTALTSFVFNLGARALATSTLLRRIEQGYTDDVPYQLRRWVNAGGKPERGLCRRRTAEAHLWIYGEWTLEDAEEQGDLLYKLKTGALP